MISLGSLLLSARHIVGMLHMAASRSTVSLVMELRRMTRSGRVEVLSIICELVKVPGCHVGLT